MHRFTKITFISTLTLVSLATGCGPIDEMADDETMMDEEVDEENTAETSEALSSVVVLLRPGHAVDKCLEVPNYSYDNGTPIVIADCVNTSNQWMWVQKSYGDVYVIRSFSSGKCLEVKNGSSDWGAEIVQANCDGSVKQQFRLKYKGSNYYEIQTVQNNHCLDVAGGSTANGTRLIQWYCNGGFNQQFYWNPPYRIGDERDACAATPNTCKTNVTSTSIVQCIYGYRTGKDRGPGTRVYDELDRCSYWHNNGCWSVNLNSGVDEGYLSCSQDVNFINCVEQVIPESVEEVEAKECIMGTLLRQGADVCEFWLPRGSLYPLYSGNLFAATTKPQCDDSWR